MHKLESIFPCAPCGGSHKCPMDLGGPCVTSKQQSRGLHEIERKAQEAIKIVILDYRLSFCMYQPHIAIPSLVLDGLRFIITMHPSQLA